MILGNPETASATFIACLGFLVAAAFIALMGALAAFAPLKYVRPNLASPNAETKFDLSAPHPQGRIFGFICFGIALCLGCFSLIPVVNATCNYDRVELKPDNLSFHYAFLKPLRSVGFEQLTSAELHQEYAVRNRTYTYWYHLIFHLKSGEKLEPAWHIEPPKDQLPEAPDYYKLVSLAEEMKKKGLPVKFTYTDQKGILHQTQTIHERPESSK